MDEKFFTTEQVANILQVHPFTILKFIKQGKLKGIKLGRVYRIKESDVEQFIEDRMTGGPSKKKEKVHEAQTSIIEEETVEKTAKQEDSQEIVEDFGTFDLIKRKKKEKTSKNNDEGAHYKIM